MTSYCGAQHRFHKPTHTYTQTDGTDSITSTADMTGDQSEILVMDLSPDGAQYDVVSLAIGLSVCFSLSALSGL